MIKANQVMDLFLEACPSYKPRWEEHYNCYYKDGEERLLYIDLGDFAAHLISLYMNNEITEFTKVFQVIEDLHMNGDDYVREAATIGLLEGIQNVAGNNNLDPEKFKPFLKTESRKWWDSLNNFHSGKIKYVGEDLNDK